MGEYQFQDVRDGKRILLCLLYNFSPGHLDLTADETWEIVAERCKYPGKTGTDIKKYYFSNLHGGPEDFLVGEELAKVAWLMKTAIVYDTQNDKWGWNERTEPDNPWQTLGDTLRLEDDLRLSRLSTPLVGKYSKVEKKILSRAELIDLGFIEPESQYFSKQNK